MLKNHIKGSWPGALRLRSKDMRHTSRLGGVTLVFGMTSTMSHRLRFYLPSGRQWMPVSCPPVAGCISSSTSEQLLTAQWWCYHGLLPFVTPHHWHNLVQRLWTWCFEHRVELHWLSFTCVLVLSTGDSSNLLCICFAYCWYFYS